MKIRILHLLPCFFIFSSSLVVLSLLYNSFGEGVPQKNSRKLLEVIDEESEPLTCTPSGINAFPKDFFTQEQRQKGGVLVHFIIALYVCATIGVVCDRYFVPSLEIIADKLKLPPDVAGATFMAIGASSPELFSSILGSFVTEGDIGVGAVLGSAVFNILGITGVAGIFLWNEVLDIDWYPLTRDCIAYGITVLCLTWIISDSIVIWWEALVLLCLFGLYIILMYFNGRVEKCSKNLLKNTSKTCCCFESKESSPLLKKIQIHDTKSSAKDYQTASDSTNIDITGGTGKSPNEGNESSQKFEDSSLEIAEGEYFLCKPSPGGLKFAWWLLMLPASTLLFLTIPNSSNHKYRKLLPITFLMSIAWLGGLSYLAVWMVTIIGYTLTIPDSISGLTILAVGASVPDLVSSVIVAKGGEGNMAISNLVGSNTFDISICLGIPWLAKALLSNGGYLRIQSAALAYTTASLMVTLVVFYLIFLLSGWKLNRTVGCICLVIYVTFVTTVCVLEFKVFGDMILPAC